MNSWATIFPTSIIAVKRPSQDHIDKHDNKKQYTASNNIFFYITTSNTNLYSLWITVEKQGHFCRQNSMLIFTNCKN